MAITGIIIQILMAQTLRRVTMHQAQKKTKKRKILVMPYGKTSRKRWRGLSSQGIACLEDWTLRRALVMLVMWATSGKKWA